MYLCMYVHNMYIRKGCTQHVHTFQFLLCKWCDLVHGKEGVASWITLNWTKLILPPFHHSVSHRQHVFSPSTTHANNSHNSHARHATTHGQDMLPKMCWNQWGQAGSERTVLYGIVPRFLFGNPIQGARKFGTTAVGILDLDWYMHRYVCIRKVPTEATILDDMIDTLVYSLHIPVLLWMAWMNGGAIRIQLKKKQQDQIKRLKL